MIISLYTFIYITKRRQRFWEKVYILVKKKYKNRLKAIYTRAHQIKEEGIALIRLKKWTKSAYEIVLEL